MALIHLDAGVLIGFLDADDVHHEGSRRLLVDAVTAGDELGIAASALAECLVGPSRRGPAATSRVHDLVDRLPLDVVPLDRVAATTAARVRADHRRLRLPDALVIATAIDADADILVTTDRRWPTARSLGLRGKVRHP